MNEEQLKADKLKLKCWSIMIPEQEEGVVLISHVRTLLEAQKRIERARAVEIIESFKPESSAYSKEYILKVAQDKILSTNPKQDEKIN